MKADLLEDSIRRVPLETILLGLAAGLATGFFLEPISGALVLGGALLAAVAFITLNSFINKYFRVGQKGLIARAISVYLLRLLLICLVFLIIIIFFKKRVLAFAAGFSLVIISVLVEALRNLTSGRQWKV
ncbi:MAG: hypothetical protein ACPLRA_05195 [Candidatus Saccharicenans sp.]